MIKVVVVILSFFVTIVVAKKPLVVPYYPGLSGGLKLEQIKVCNEKRLTWCPRLYGKPLVRCMKINMQNTPECQQSLLFLDATNGFFNDVQTFKQAAVVKAKVVAADRAVAYYIVSRQGEVVQLLTNLAMDQLKGYQQAKTIYPKMALFSMSLSAPKHEALPKDGLRLIFQQSVLNGCLACSEVGQASVAYDFNKAGKFQGAKVISLVTGF